MPKLTLAAVAAVLLASTLGVWDDFRNWLIRADMIHAA
jgi:hypothetical protein